VRDGCVGRSTTNTIDDQDDRKGTDPCLMHRRPPAPPVAIGRRLALAPARIGIQILVTRQMRARGIP
jgi:hypothetical protein